MNIQTYRIALGGVMAALSIVILLIGSTLGIGIYIAPMLAGLCLLPVGRELGRRVHILIWLVVSLLCFILISDMEQNLMYLCLFGCYPILRPSFQRLKNPLRLLVKLIFFNAVSVAAEVLVLTFFVPESLGTGMIVTLLLLGNLTFLCYDRILPVFDAVLSRYLLKYLKSRR